MEQKGKNKVLLHACCAICSAYPIEMLQNEGYEVVVHFYNPNIYPKNEYLKRLEAEKHLCTRFHTELIEDNYDEGEFLNFVKGYENCPEKGERCSKCFELRLRKTARLALAKGIKNFTTSIAISPHKNFKILSEIGDSIAKESDLNYLAIDFKKKDGFLKTNKIASSLGLYRQNYCGCRFSQNH